VAVANDADTAESNKLGAVTEAAKSSSETSQQLPTQRKFR
jgi:hypothetical protein